MLPKLIASLAAAATLVVSLPVHAQAGSTKLAMLDPFTISHTRPDNGMLRVKGNTAGTRNWPVIHGPSYYPMWNDGNALRDGKGAPLESDRFHFR
ncbi:hypothetical protein [Trinickia mobilis]|uniref:hypothetical protein n=1 Tax=Trinickia mobilis TaxID=2816356 RepID=UPI001A8C9609|nr:hypothetical protein [Trinickia mobilis]